MAQRAVHPDVEAAACPCCGGEAVFREIQGVRVGACTRWGCWWSTDDSGSTLWQRDTPIPSETQTERF